LITHWGLSGPAILKLSALGARALADRDYRFDVSINWVNLSREAVETSLQGERESSPRKRIRSGASSFGLPNRLWAQLVEAAEISVETTWSNLSKQGRLSLVEQLVASQFSVDGKSMNKEEFVTAGGINLREVNFKTMESKIVPRLYFAGEVLDIDGVTGGFNFQAAWTTGRIAGESAAAAIFDPC
jgi:predicted Rossmann fold flavoprotein